MEIVGCPIREIKVNHMCEKREIKASGAQICAYHYFYDPILKLLIILNPEFLRYIPMQRYAFNRIFIQNILKTLNRRDRVAKY
jgi:hypothetical protein